MPTPITASSFFSNAAARDYGFTSEFWLQAYRLYEEAADHDPDPSMEKYFLPRTLRLPFQNGQVDVLVHTPPQDPGEFVTYRLTAFPADDQPEPRQLSNVYWYDDNSRPVLGEAALLDVGNRW